LTQKPVRAREDKTERDLKEHLKSQQNPFEDSPAAGYTYEPEAENLPKNPTAEIDAENQDNDLNSTEKKWWKFWD
jgi:hypothetical protein